MFVCLCLYKTGNSTEKIRNDLEHRRQSAQVDKRRQLDPKRHHTLVPRHTPLGQNGQLAQRSAKLHRLSVHVVQELRVSHRHRLSHVRIGRARRLASRRSTHHAHVQRAHRQSSRRHHQVLDQTQRVLVGAFGVEREREHLRHQDLVRSVAVAVASDGARHQGPQEQSDGDQRFRSNPRGLEELSVVPQVAQRETTRQLHAHSLDLQIGRSQEEPRDEPVDPVESVRLPDHERPQRTTIRDEHHVRLPARHLESGC